MHYVELREEAIKSGEHFHSNESVYFDQSLKRLSNSRGITPESYLNGRIWIECHFVLQGERNADYVAVICGAHNDIVSEFQGDAVDCPAHGNAVGRKPSVLVEVTHLVQPPQRVTFESVSSVIWLKRLDFAKSGIGHAGDLSLEPLASVTVPNFDYRELSFSRDSVQSGQRPYSLIESRTHVVNSVPRDKANFRRDIVELRANDIPFLFFILVFGNGISLRWRAESADFGIKGIQVILRPTQLRVGIGHAQHGKSIAGHIRDIKG